MNPPYYNTASDIAQFMRDNLSIEPRTNKFTILKRIGKDEKNESHTSLLVYETDTCMVHGSSMDGDVFLGLDSRSTIRRTFMTNESAREFIVRYLEARANDMSRKLVLVETDAHASSIVVPNNGIVRPS